MYKSSQYAAIAVSGKAEAGSAVFVYAELASPESVIHPLMLTPMELLVIPYACKGKGTVIYLYSSS